MRKLVAICFCLAALAAFAADSNPVAPLPAGLWMDSDWLTAADAPVYTGDRRQRGGGDERAADGTAFFVSQVTNAQAVARAVWMTAGLGVYEVFVNGRRVGDDFLKPGFTDALKTKYAFTYDVTDLMRREKGAVNGFAAEVSSGWWRDRIAYYIGRKSAFRAVLQLTFADGTTEIRRTNARDWLAGTAGPVTHAGIYDGEEYDARIPRPFDGRGLSTPDCSAEFQGEILPTDGGEVVLRRDRTLRPVAAYVWRGTEGASGTNAFGRVIRTRAYRPGEAMALRAGETLVVDFGQNAAAVPEFDFEAKEGVTLTALPAEALNDSNGERARGNDGPAGSVYRANLRKSASGMRIVYTFAGGRAAYLPRYTFFGYRYVSLTATGDVTVHAIASVPVTSVTKAMERGSLATGDATVNRFIRNVEWGFRSNYLSIPTDCPQRNERCGWGADNWAFATAALYTADVANFLRKHCRDIRDIQDGASGGFYTHAPRSKYSGESPSAASYFDFGWADAGVIVPYRVWRMDGGLRILREHYDAMRRFVDAVDANEYEPPYYQYIFGDWLSFEKYESCGNQYGDYSKWSGVPEAREYMRFLAQCFWVGDAEKMAEMAAALRNGGDAARYAAMAARARRVMRGRFLEADGRLKRHLRELQTANVFALQYGIVEGAAKARTLDDLVALLRANGNRMTTGFLGAEAILPTLTANGRADVAWDVFLGHDFPSWLYSVDQGATTVWERWNSYTKEKGFGPVSMNSFNHYAYGSVLAWLYESAAGIAPDEAGFSRARLAPKPDRRLGSLTATFDSPAGRIASAWRYEGDAWVWTFTTPVPATVVLPGETTERAYGPGTYTLRK